mmetsp:Transcript_10772/g.21423  ORF Transcript_10772/g.21423 Transcript_10772/m.21423 type:complete len:580 (+) Transcript_10772:81-1820(+)
MSGNKKTITIPSNVGSATLTETFGKITLSSEVKDLLASLNAELSVRYIPGGEKPVLQVLSRTGKTMCTLEEFKALSGYRRFVSDTLKEVEKASSTDKKINLITFMLKQAKTAGVTVPERILEQNMTKFNQVGTSIQMLTHHLEVIDGTVNNEWKKYLHDRGVAIARLLYSCQVACMGSDVVDKAYIEDGLFKAGVPKWLYTKFLDKNFTNNLKRDSFTLLFPKGNFLKAIALTTKEIQHENFRKQNQLILQMSGGIITLAATNFSQLFPSIKQELGEPIREFLTGYQWVCTTPLKAEEILDLRETGKSFPVIRDAQAPKKTGKEKRPESEVTKITRQVGNTLNYIQGTWNSIMNFCIPVANPKTEFWANLFTVRDWDVTPTNSIYNCIRNEATHKSTLQALREKPSGAQLKAIALIVSQQLAIPAETSDCNLVVDSFKDITNEPFTSVNLPDVSADYKLADLDGYDETIVSRDEMNVARDFLGVKGKVSTKKKISGAGAVRLTTAVLNELAPLRGSELYDKIVMWLMTSFKTGSRNELQKLAAERVLGEALKHQETIFGDEFEEEVALQEMEEYDEDEE